MYPSGRWDGFWVQAGWGRQPMTPFTLRFDGGRITGEGVDVIGPFTFAGTVDAGTGRVRRVKQYLGAHTVVYVGEPDGEGAILGTWAVGGVKGPFGLKPVLGRPTGDEPIREIK